MLAQGLAQRLRPMVALCLSRDVSGTEYRQVDWFSPAIRYLRYLGVDIANMIRLYKRFGKTKYFTRDNVTDLVEFFDQVGVRGTAIKDAIICAPDLLRVPLNVLESRACWYRDVFNFSHHEFRQVIELYPNLLEDKATLRFEEALQYFKELGITRDQYRNMLIKCPTILHNSIPDSVSKTVDFFLNRGVEKSVMVESLIQFPEMLNFSLMGHILPKARFFEIELEISQEQFANVFIRHGWVLGLNLESDIRNTVQWLLDFGASKKALGAVLLKYPAILGYSVENNFKPKLDYFIHYLGIAYLVEILRRKCGLLLGMPFGEMALLIEKHPGFIGASLKEHIRPFVWCLEHELSMPVGDIYKIFLKEPALFGIPFPSAIKPTIDYFLQELNCRRDLLARMLLAYPQLLCYSLEDNIKPRIEWLRQTVGIPEEKLTTVALHRLYPYSIETLNNKLHFVRSQLDISHDEMVMMVCEDASFFHKSLSNLAKKIQFAETELGKDRSAIVDFPPFLGFSLASRLRLRTAFLRSIEMDLASLSLKDLFGCSDEQFLQSTAKCDKPTFDKFHETFQQEIEALEYEEDQKSEEQMMEQTFLRDQSLSPIEDVREAERRFARDFKYQHAWD